MNNPKIAGALYDFVGYLTRYPETIKTGSKHTVYQIHEIMMEWAKLRDLNLDDPDIANWGEDDRVLHKKYPELERLYKKKYSVELEYFMLRKLLNDY